ncbi:LOW QUALITY PROTEIN: hypothetical protein PHMEG_0005215 [Phytophthora megakarya]|uniref:Uncharacterized protein n=1 Tax=Phytophthora megakarya TaxID=4795 RepID=A0A225WRW6_9STRA|nr:LOW QUALITY PROTEIN: hypothetical protein PHMEG_0005215 [Phytophthora megakarya]
MMGDIPRDVQLRNAQEWSTMTNVQLQYEIPDLGPGSPNKRPRSAEPKTITAGQGLSVTLPSLSLPRADQEVDPSWHGPIRILEKGSDFRYRLQVEGTEYGFYPWVHVKATN